MPETFESQFKKLESAVSELESGDLSLEEALKTFEQGVKWSRKCQQFLDKAERRIETVLKSEKTPEGGLQQTTFFLDEE